MRSLKQQFAEVFDPCETIEDLSRFKNKSHFIFGLALFIFLSCFVSNKIQALDAGDVTITMSTAPFYVLDSNAPCTDGPKAAYIGFEICNISGADLTDMRVTLDGFTTAGFGLAGGQISEQYIGLLEPLGCDVVYWYTEYPCTIGLNTDMTVTVSDDSPGTATMVQNMLTRSCISANAGGILEGFALTGGGFVGTVLEETVTYSFGNTGAGDEFNIQPSGNLGFDASCFQLINSVIVSSQANAIPAEVEDDLYFIATGSQGGSGKEVVVKYYFKVLCTSSTTTALPYAAQTSGANNVKYTGNFGDPDFTEDFPLASDPFEISKIANPSQVPITGGTIEFTVTIKNIAAETVMLDSIVDIIPSGMTFNSTSATSEIDSNNSTFLPSNGDGPTLAWKGLGPGAVYPYLNYFIPGNDSLQLIYTVDIPDGTSEGVYSNSVRIYSGQYVSQETTENFLVGNPNNPPIAEDDSFVTGEDTLLSDDVSLTDDATDGPQANYSLVSDVSNGTLLLDPSGTFTYLPDENYVGSDSFTYSLCDGSVPEECDNAIVSITVDPSNDPPVVENDLAETDEDTAVIIAVLGNDNDDLDPLGGMDVNSVNVTSGPTNGTVQVNPDGTITYTPADDYNGPDSFTYEVCDTGNPAPGICGVAQVDITVNPTNDPPVVENDVAETDEETAVVITVLGNDNDDLDPSGGLDISTVNVTSGPSNGTVQVNPDGTITYTPADDYNGPDSFNYEVCDTGNPAPGVCSTAQVDITVNPSNDPPVIENDLAETDEDTAVIIAVLGNDNDDLDPLGGMDVSSVNVTSGPTNGTVQVNPDGTITYTPDDDYNGPDSFTYEVCDTGNPAPGICGVAQVDITVNPTNDPPLVENDLAETDEETAVVISVLGNDNDDLDPSGGLDISTVNVTSGPSNGTVQVNPDGTITYTPADDYNGPDSFNYEVCDTGNPAPGVCGTAQVDITVNPSNDPPVVENDLTETDEDTAVIIAVLGNDNDDLDPLGGMDVSSVNVTSGPTNGTVQVNPDGTITYTPDDDYNGPDSFTYEVCDTGNPAPGICGSAQVDINVDAVNDMPLVQDDSNSTPQGTPVTTNVLSNDNDDLDPLGNLDISTVTITTDPINGTVDVNPDGTITYTPNSGYTGEDTYTYSVCDDGNPLPALCDEALVTITISNEAPQADDDSDSVMEDSSVTTDVLINDSDPNDNIDPGTLVIFSDGANGSAVVNPDGTITYTPDPDFNGVDSYSYQICDEDDFCATGIVDITVNPVNDLPVAEDDLESTSEDTAVIITVVGNDDDPIDPLGNIDTSTVTVTTDPVNGTATVNPDGTVTYMPNEDFNGEDTFIYEVCDDGNPLPALCTEAMVTITVDPVNDPPVADDESETTLEDTAVTTEVLDGDSDLDGALDITTVAIDTDPTNGSAVVNPDGTITYTPNPNYNGPDSYTYTVCDDGTPLPAMCTTAQVDITVSPENDAPNIANDLAETDEDTDVIIPVLDNDNDDTDPAGGLDVSTVTITSDPTNGTVEVNPDGTVTYSPNENYNGPDVFTYQVCDTGNPAPGICAEAQVDITVNPVNDAPIAEDDSDATPTETPTTTDVLNNDEDADGTVDATTVTIIDGPTDGTVDVNPDGTITYTPDTGFEGEDSYTYQVCDDGDPQECDTAEVVITVNNNTPIADNDEEEVDEDNSVEINVIDNDFDPNDDLDPTSVVILDGPSNGEVTVNPDGSVTYTPDEDYNGPDSFEYQVCDLEGYCDNAIVDINVIPVNDGVIAIDDINNTLVDQSVDGNVMFNDSDPDGDDITVTLSLASEPSNGSVIIDAEGNYTYTPETGFIGEDSFSYQVCDNGEPSACEEAIVTIQVIDNSYTDNDAPVANNDAYLVEMNQDVEGDLLSNDGDPDGDDLTVNTTPISDPANGTVVINPDGTFLYIPMTDFVGEDSFIYEVCDDADPAICDQATVTIIVTDPLGNGDVNHPPFAADDAFVGSEDEVLLGSLLNNDYDVDGDEITINVEPITGPSNGTIVINPDGSFTYTQNEAEWSGTDQFTYQICDEFGLCEEATVYITIVPENDPLIITAANDIPELDEQFEDVTISTPEEMPFDLCFTIEDIDGVGTNMMFESASILNGIIEDGTADDLCLTYTPNENFNGLDTLVISICDDFGACDDATVIIDVTPVNDPPLAVDDGSVTDDQTPIDIGVLTNDFDIDEDELTVSLVTDPENGTATVNPDGTINYVPDFGFCGNDTFTYIICDGADPELCDEASVTVAVTQADSDSDGIPDVVETTEADTDEDGIPDYLETDSDDDTIPDALESQLDTTDPCNVTVIDSDEDGIPDHQDLDADDDGILDEVEAGDDGNNPVDTDGDDIPDYLDLDSDNDTIPDEVEGGDDPANPTDTDGDGIPDFQELDSDNDSIPDEVEAGDNPTNPVDTDENGDPDYQDLDSDNDSIPDEVEAGDDGNNPVDTDGNGDPDYQDLDSDDDTIPDEVEAGDDPTDPVDTDGNGDPDYQDTDSDDDTIPDEVEAGDDPTDPVDTDGNGDPDYQDTDSDDDSIPDEVEAGEDPTDPVDTDGNGDPDYQDTDSDDDSIPDEVEAGEDPTDPVDTDGNGDPDYQDLDSDGDTIPDEIEAGDDPTDPVDTDEDGDPDYVDVDSDNDTVLDVEEAGDNPGDPIDTDEDGTPDFQDIDSDGDGIADEIELWSDCDGDGIPDFRDPDECISELIIPQGFSPNGDGVAETWVIDGLNDLYPNNSVVVFNRWGNEVYKQNQYMNDFNGDGNTNGAGSLPGGTYFYIIDPGADGIKKIQGFVYINR